jgi:hypothetical protein
MQASGAAPYLPVLKSMLSCGLLCASCCLPDEELLRAGGREEEEDVAAFVAAYSKREEQRQREAAEAGGSPAPADERLGAVEFGDVEDEPDYGRLVQRARGGAQDGSGQHASAGRGTSRRGTSRSGRGVGASAQGAAGTRAPVVQLRAGALVRAGGQDLPEERRSELFGLAAASCPQRTTQRARPPQENGDGGEGGSVGRSACRAGAHVPVPEPVDPSTFEGLGLAPVLGDHLEALNFAAPTRVQQAALPVLLAGRDALVRAPTGSGKTLAYLAPLVHDLQV